MWLYWDGGGNHYFITLGNGTAGGKVFSCKLTTGSGIVAFFDGATVINSTNAVPTSTWTHVVLTYSGTSLKIYINGSLDSTHTAANLNIASSGNGGNIGSYYYNGTGGQYAFKGKIDQVRIFNDSLTSDEVLELYNNEIACS